MPNQSVLAADIGCPFEPAYATTDAGRMYLLIQTIVDRLHVEGTTATFELTSELADELAAFGSEQEDLEQDDPTEEDMPDEEGEQLESDSRKRFGSGETATAVVRAGGRDDIEPYRPG